MNFFTKFKRKVKLIVYFIILVVIILAMIGHTVTILPLIERGVNAKGLVVESKEKHKRSHGYAKILFKTSNHKTYRLEMDQPFFRELKTGEEVEVLYDPENPNKAELNGFIHIWLAPLLILLILLAAPAYLFIYINKRLHKKRGHN